MTADFEQRHIAFEGCFNFRDLGGYRTRRGNVTAWRRLYRSSEIHKMTDADAARARGELGVKTVIDLRQPGVAARNDDGPLVRPPTCYYNVPLIDDGDAPEDSGGPSPVVAMSEEYLRRLEQPRYGEGIVQVLKRIGEPGALPGVVHCSAGKDRTGLVAAVLLGVLGVEDEDIVRDYALTARYMPGLLDHWWESERDSQSSRYSDLPPYTYDSRPETMEHVLATLNQRYGGMRGYVERNGGDAALIRSLENALLA